MARFQPFSGIFYDDPQSSPEDGVLDISTVIGDDATSEFAAVNILDAPELAESWLSQKRLRSDDEAALYMFRAGHRGPTGVPVQVAGVFGLADGGGGWTARPQILEIENDEFDHLLIPNGLPIVTATDAQGTHYRLWAIRQRGVIETISDAVNATGACPDGLVAATTGAIDLPPGLVFARS